MRVYIGTVLYKCDAWCVPRIGEDIKTWRCQGAYRERKGAESGQRTDEGFMALVPD